MVNGNLSDFVALSNSGIKKKTFYLHFKVQTKEMQNNKTDMASNVDHVKHKSKKGLKPADRKPAKMIKNCKYCGGSHLQAKFPAYGKKCNICFKNNHFAKVCKQIKV